MRDESQAKELTALLSPASFARMSGSDLDAGALAVDESTRSRLRARGCRPGARFEDLPADFKIVPGPYYEHREWRIGPARPLTAALVMVARDGMDAVARVLGVAEFGAVAAIAFALHVAKGRVRLWRLTGVEREFRCPFSERVEQIEEGRREQARGVAT